MAGRTSRIERDAGTGKFVKAGTERKHPKTTVTEPRTKKPPRRK